MINACMDRMILGDGENCVYSSDSNVTGLNNNVIAVGTSGCGKTVSLIEPRLLETFCRSLIVTVTKRRIVKKIYSCNEKTRVSDLGSELCSSRQR